MGRPNNAEAIAGRVQGLREAKAAFQALPEIVRDRSNAATELTVREIVRHARAHLEASPSIRTRALYNHVAWKMNYKNGRGKAGIATGTTTFRSGGKTIRIKGIVTAAADGGATGWKSVQPTRYAHLVELGRAGVPAEPFMRPSAESQKQPYLQRMQAANRAVEQDVAKIGMRNL